MYKVAFIILAYLIHSFVSLEAIPVVREQKIEKLPSQVITHTSDTYCIETITLYQLLYTMIC